MKAESPEIARQCVLMAIDKIKGAIRLCKRTEESHSASGLDRQRARENVRLVEAEFGQQWENVESLLALLPETSENWDWPPVSNVG